MVYYILNNVQRLLLLLCGMRENTVDRQCMIKIVGPEYIILILTQIIRVLHYLMLPFGLPKMSYTTAYIMFR